LDADIAFTVASARSIHSIIPILGDLPLRLPVIEFNGSFLSNLHSMSHVLVNAITHAAAQRVVRIANERGFAPCVSSFDGHRDNLYCPAPTNDGMSFYVTDRRRHGDPRLRPTRDLTEHLNEQVVCLTFIDTRRRLEVLRQAIRASEPDLDVHLYENWYSPGWWWLTVHSHESGKATALESLKKVCGLDDHRTTVFGDQVNDISMMEYADYAVAVCNAVPEVHEIADEVVGNNNSDSVAIYIARKEGLLPDDPAAMRGAGDARNGKRGKEETL
jgi:hydroxymethylpyrimidine pyrophosphatase-like HAD family hydrolase